MKNNDPKFAYQWNKKQESNPKTIADWYLLQRKKRKKEKNKEKANEIRKLWHQTGVPPIALEDEIKKDEEDPLFWWIG